MIFTAYIDRYNIYYYYINPESLSYEYFSYPILPSIYFDSLLIDKLLESFNTKGAEKVYVFSSNKRISTVEKGSKINYEFSLEGIKDLNIKNPVYYIGFEGSVSTKEHFKNFSLESSYNVSSNLLQNMLIYGPKIPVSDYDRSFYEALNVVLTKNILSKDALWSSNKTLTLSGPLFNMLKKKSESIFYVLESINRGGVWDISIDFNHLFPAIRILSKFDKPLAERFSKKHTFETASTVAVINDCKEAVLDFGLSSSQKINFSKKRIAILPISKKNKAKVEIFGKKPLKMEVAGSVFGLIIDTRDRPLDLESKIKIEESRKEVEMAMGERL